jgi:hypothetical protein
LIRTVGVPDIAVGVGYSAETAIAPAAVVVDNVSIIAFFPASAEINHIITGNAIAAASERAKVCTSVCVNTVVVIAILITLVVNTEISADYAIAAARKFTTVGAGVMINAITVIAAFAAIETVIAAAGKTAIGVAAVAIDAVAIVTCLISRLTLDDIEAP